MSTVTTYIEQINRKIIGLVALATLVAFSIVSCGEAQTQGDGEGGISPDAAVDYIHTVLLADRTAYTQHVVNRLQMLEGDENPDGIVPAEATEDWRDTDGIPLPAQMFRLGSEIATGGGGAFTYGLISPWYINDSQEPQPGFEEEAMQEVIDTGEPYKDYQEIGGQTYFSAVYPDEAVAEACVSCHNNHPIHQERYPDKVFEMGDVMGGVVINLPIDEG